jgi:N-acetylmuramoyl-L-alanine amidase
MKIISNFSPNHSKKTRFIKNIKFVIIHYTGMQSEIESINRLKNPKFKVSCHYLINRKGQIVQMVKDKKVAWHAGKSKWKNFINLNKSSIGIELINKGHQYGYQSFSAKQINSLIKLCKNLKKKYSIKKENFLGHSDIAPLRKIDPGEKFPWKKLSMHNLGRWYENENTHIKFDMSKMRELFFKNLKKLGYRYFSVYERKITDRRVVKSFQQKYLPKQVTGKIDEKTLKISHFLTI